MKKYRIYRSIRVESVEQVNFDSIGISWAADELSAINFSEQFGSDFIVVSAVVSCDEININQTNAQWNSKDQQHESEVVLKENIDFQIEFEGNKYNANTGWMSDSEKESRPNPEYCEVSYVTDFLESE